MMLQQFCEKNIIKRCSTSPHSDLFTPDRSEQNEEEYKTVQV